MKRLKDLLQKKIDIVQRAELERKWSDKTIQTETEFLLLVKNLIEENESLKFEKLDIRPARSSIAEYLLYSAVYEMYQDIETQTRYVNIDYLYYEKLLNLTESKLLRHSIKLMLKSYYRQELTISSLPAEREMLYNRLEQLTK